MQNSLLLNEILAQFSDILPTTLQIINNLTPNQLLTIQYPIPNSPTNIQLISILNYCEYLYENNK